MENAQTEIEEKMGQTPTFNDRFSRPLLPARTGLSGGRDRFAGQGAPAGRVDHFGKAISGTKGDAFAGAQAMRAAPVDRFGGKPTPARTDGFSSPPPTVAAPALAKRVELRVVAKRPEPEAVVLAAEPVEVKYQDVKREEAWRRRAGKSSSLVLVSGAPALAASDVAEAPPPPAKADLAPAPPPPPLIVEPKPRSGGGGGGSGSGGGAPPRERGFNQDDFVGVMLGVAVLFLLLLWLLRGGPPQDNQIVGVQSAMNDPLSLPAAAPAPPPLPPPDPFGNAAVDLTPKGPIPEPVQADTPPPAEAKAAPAAAPAPVADRAMHAWFCTAGSKLTVASRTALERELTQFTDAFAGRELIVRGYADTRGSTDFNSMLGGERARVVADFLRTKGLTIIDDKGIGELSGLDDNQNCSNQRRVDVFVKGGPGETPSRACAPEPAVEDLMCG